MIFTDGVRLTTDGENNELHSFVSLLGLDAKWCLFHGAINYEIKNLGTLESALRLGAKPVHSSYIVPGKPFTISKFELGITTQQDVIGYHKMVVAHIHQTLLDSSTSQYEKQDLLGLRRTLVSHTTLESAKKVLDILDHDEYVDRIPRNSKEWAKHKIARLDREYSFAVDFLKLPFIRIPLIINRYGKDGIASIILRWRLEIGK